MSSRIFYIATLLQAGLAVAHERVHFAPGEDHSAKVAALAACEFWNTEDHGYIDADGGVVNIDGPFDATGSENHQFRAASDDDAYTLDPLC